MRALPGVLSEYRIGLVIALLAATVACYSAALGETKSFAGRVGFQVLLGTPLLLGIALALAAEAGIAARYGGLAGLTVIATAGYSMLLLSAIAILYASDGAPGGSEGEGN